MTRPDYGQVGLSQAIFGEFGIRLHTTTYLQKRRASIPRGNAVTRNLCLAAIVVLSTGTHACAGELIIFASSNAVQLSKSALRGYAAAKRTVTNINRSGGVLGQHVRLKRVEDNCTSDGGKKIAEKIVAMRPSLVVGHQCSNAAIAAAKVYARHNIIFMATRTRHPDLTDKRAGPTIFRCAPRGDRQATIIANRLMASAIDRKIVILHDRTAQMQKLAKDVKQQVAKLATQQKQTQPDTKIFGFMAGKPDYSDLIKQIIDERRTTTVLAAFPTEAEIISQNLNDHWKINGGNDHAKIIGNETLITPAYLDRTASSILPTEVPVPTTNRALSLVHQITGTKPDERYRRKPDPRSKIAIELWRNAVLAARVSYSRAVARSLPTLTNIKAGGNYGFNKYGDGNHKSHLMLSHHQSRRHLEGY